MSLPKPTSNLSLDGNFSSKTSLSATREILSFGTSIPTAERPGIGASIRTSLAANAKAISLCKFTILLTFTPCAGCTSYCVTAGPILICVTLASTPKFFIVDSRT